MGLLTRLKGNPPAARAGGDLAADARSMRRTLAAIQAELDRVNGGAAPLDLRAVVRDLLEGEVEAPTADVASLVRAGVTPESFYRSEIGPSWDGLGEAQRAARVEGFIDLARMMDEPGAAAGLPGDMAARVHTKTLLLAWAFDETHGYLASLARPG